MAQSERQIVSVTEDGGELGPSLAFWRECENGTAALENSPAAP